MALSQRPSLWRMIVHDGDVESGTAQGENQAPIDFGLDGWDACDVMDTAGDQVACALAVAVARCCSCCDSLVQRQHWRVIRKKIWKGRRRASAAAALDAVVKEEQARMALAKLRPTEAAAVKKAATKAAQAATAESVKAAAAAAAAAERGDNSCAESSTDEAQSWFRLQQRGDGVSATAEVVSDGSDESSHERADIMSNARRQKSASQIKNGAGAKALEAMKQQLLVLPKSPAAENEDKSHSRLEQRFSLADAAAYLQQCAPDRAAAIKARTARMTEIHREIKQEKDGKRSIVQQHEKFLESKAGALSPETLSASTPAPRPGNASAQPLTLSSLSRPRFPSLRLDAALLLSATALQFYASVRTSHDVRCLVSDASLFVARHVGVYCKVWAAWEWHWLVEHELMQHLRQSVPLLPETGVAAAADAAAALLTWPWYLLRLLLMCIYVCRNGTISSRHMRRRWMPRLHRNASAFVSRSVIAAVPAVVEVADNADVRLPPLPKKKTSPKKDVSKSKSQPAATATVKVATAQSLAAEVCERVMQLPLRHRLRHMMESSVVQYGAALLACGVADERAEVAVKAATRAPPMQKDALNAAAAAAQHDASACQVRFQNFLLPPLLQWASGRSTLHSLLSVRDGRVIGQQHAQEKTEFSLSEMQEESLRALLHPELASSPHLAPFAFCENSTDPSFFAEAPITWILAMSGAVVGEHLQYLHDELLGQWQKFVDEALQSPIPKKIGKSEVPAGKPWNDRLRTLYESCGSRVGPKPDALTVREKMSSSFMIIESSHSCLQVICWVVAARCCPVELRLKAAIAVVSLCSRISSIGIESQGAGQDTFPPFQKHNAQITSNDQPLLLDEGGIPTIQLLHGRLNMNANPRPSLHATNTI
jgi:hypothetical protein